MKLEERLEGIDVNFTDKVLHIDYGWLPYTNNTYAKGKREYLIIACKEYTNNEIVENIYEFAFGKPVRFKDVPKEDRQYMNDLFEKHKEMIHRYRTFKPWWSKNDEK